MRNFLKMAVVGAAIVGGCPVGAKAAVIFDSITGATAIASQTISLFAAASFTSESSASNLLSVTIYLYSGPDTNSFEVDLYSDNSTNPGSKLLTIASVVDDTIASPGAATTFTLATPYALTVNTRYWIETSGNQSLAAWAFTNLVTGIEVSSEYRFVNGSVYLDSSASYMMQVTTDSVPTNRPSVPEPASMALLGAGLVGLGGFARRRRG